ncbi:hypothetical protein D8674_022518 [Pyrus ussuriensis x Pyrus communis]|uniref:Uncharacterized protein n=1 Tax=Pyrus ussuriensis x Pyrus communis TaxID=2448454 RepID=A0A5N5GRT6_9ROSA|nr:hypothetical protein D8674_022518 [Pyrus ussuriensis x Pyrus communis]
MGKGMQALALHCCKTVANVYLLRTHVSNILVPHRPQQEWVKQRYKINKVVRNNIKYTFLGLLAKIKSSVVSVLISLISDTWTNGLHDIKLIF